MKNLTRFFFLTIGLYCSAFAQDKWAWNETTFAGLHYAVAEECGDTLINGDLHAILWKSVYGFNLNKLDARRAGYTRTIGDSTLLTRTSFGQPPQPEILLYNFNVDVGDTLYLKVWYFMPDTFAVTHVDTIRLLNQDRRRIRIEHIRFNYEDIWVEGIGSIVNGYLHRGESPFVADAGTSFSCYNSHEEDSTWAPYDSIPCFLDQINPNCNTTTSIFDSEKKPQIELSPNPFSDRVRLSHLPVYSKVAVYDIWGRKVKEIEIREKNLDLALSYLSPGVYVFLISVENKSVAAIKTVKR